MIPIYTNLEAAFTAGKKNGMGKYDENYDTLTT